MPLVGSRDNRFTSYSAQLAEVFLESKIHPPWLVSKMYVYTYTLLKLE